MSHTESPDFDRLAIDRELIQEARRDREEIKRLRTALEPFQRNVEALSLSAALGHIGREELWAARHAFTGEQSTPAKDG